MNKPLLLFTCVVLAFTQCAGKGGVEQQAAPAGTAVVADGQPLPADTVPLGAAMLMKVYPQQVLAYEADSLLMADGTRIVYDDGKQKDFVTMLDHSDPEDMFTMAYDTTAWQPAYLSDAGRSRCEELFKSMYGHSEAEARQKLVVWPAAAVHVGQRCCRQPAGCGSPHAAPPRVC